MSIFVIAWGTKTRDDVLGKVVDACPVCDGLREFVIREHYQVGHLYAIPLGPWCLVAASRTCTVCDRQFPCVPSRYDKVVPVPIAKTLRFIELLEQTNSFLAARHENSPGEAEPEAAGVTNEVFDADATNRRSVTVRAPAEYVDLQALYDMLERHTEGRSEAAPFFDELRSWRSLTASQRDDLRKRIAAFDDDQARLDQARHFLRRLAGAWPNSFDATQSAILVVAVMLLLIPLWFILQSPTVWDRDGIGIIPGYLACLGSGAYVIFKVSMNAARRAWLREHGLDYAIDFRVEREAVVRVLKAPINQNWDRSLIWTILAMKRFRQDIDRQLENLPPPAPDGERADVERTESERYGIRDS